MSSTAEKDAVFQIMGGTPHPVIVELGAHIGEEYLWLRNLTPASYVMVEPDLENCEKILELNPEADLLVGAIAKYNGLTKFYSSVNHASKNRASGSTHRPTGHLEHFPEVTFSETKSRRPCWKLDLICKYYPHIDLLWCDIQGAERDMIEGGRATLAKTRYMMIEAEEVELYEGQALRPELLALLPDWEVIKEFGANLLLRNVKYGE